MTSSATFFSKKLKPFLIVISAILLTIFSFVLVENTSFAESKNVQNKDEKKFGKNNLGSSNYLSRFKSSNFLSENNSIISKNKPAFENLMAGGLDTTFGTNGIVTTPIGSGDDFGNGVVVQTDGKIVVAGYSHNGTDNDFAVTRYNSDGTLDNTFGTGGKVTTAIGSADDFAYGVVLQSDGKIVVAGYSHNGTDNDFAVVRYNTDGTLDTSFDNDGIATTDFSNSNDEAFGIAIQNNTQTIVVAGYSHNGTDNDFAIVRYNTDGSLDTSFSSDGKARTSVGSGDDFGFAVSVENDFFLRRIVIAGVSNNGTDFDFGVVVFNNDGSLYTTFDGDGKVLTPFGSGDDFATSVVMFNGGILAGGFTTTSAGNNDFAMAAYRFTGSLDTNFDGDGKVITPITNSFDEIFALNVQQDGNIIAGGISNNDFALARYNANGSLDTTFDSNGIVTTPIGSSEDKVRGLAIQNGKAVAAGYSQSTSQGKDFAVARYLLGNNLSINDVSINEADTGTTNFEFTVSLNLASSETVMVDYATADGTATSAEDYNATSGTLTFAPGETEKNISVQVIGDTTVETNETFTINLSNASNADIADGEGLGTIRNDDIVNNTSYVVNTTGDEADPLNDGICDVDLQTQGRQCTLRAAIQQPIVSDIGKNISFNIPGGGVKVITLNSSLPTVRSTFINGYTQPGASRNTLPKGEGSNANLLIEIRGSGNFTALTLVSNAFSRNSGISGLLINGNGGIGVGLGSGLNTIDSVTGCWFGLNADGSASKLRNSINIFATSTSFVDDNVISNADVGIKFSNGLRDSNGLSARVSNNYIGTDPTGTQSRGNSTGVELDNNEQIGLNENLISGNETGIKITNNQTETGVSLFSNKIGTKIDGSSPLPNDIGINVTSPTTIINNIIGHNLSVGIIGDNFASDINSTARIESNEIFSSQIGINLLGGLIINNKIFNNLSKGVVTNGGPAILSNSIYSNGSIGIDIGDDGVTPNNPDPFISDAPVISFVTSENSQTRIVGTHTSANYPTYKLEFFTNPNPSPSGYGEGKTKIGETVVDAIGSGEESPFDVVFDIDIPNQSYVSATASAGNFVGNTSEFSKVVQANCDFSISSAGTNIPSTGGSSSFNVTVDKGCVWTPEKDVDWITIDSGSGDGDGTVDFTVAPNPNNTVRTGNIIVGNQTFIVTQNFAPTISISDVSAQEGNSGTSNFNFTVNLSASNTKSISVDYATADGTAIEGKDFVSSSGTVTFAAGETSKTITVQVNGDNSIEPNETFVVNLSNPVNATISDNQATGTIQNDDVGGTMEFSAANYTVDENVGTATITVNRTGGAASGVSVDYATSNGTATAKQDYTSSSGTITFGANETSKTFTVPIINDSIDESSETINLTLSNPSGGTIGSQNTATITINDNDEPSAISINDASINEGNSGTSTLNFTVSLSKESAFPIMVDYLTNNGTATAGKDYTTANGTLTFAAGETNKTIGVEISGDTTVEPNENFTVILSNPSNATIADSQGTGTIQNDDTGGTVQFSTASFSVNENAGTASVTVTRTGGTAGGVSVNYSTSNGTATSGEDYTPASGTLTFGANETSKSFNVSITNDSQGENNETIDLTLINPMGGGTLGTPSAAVLTIIDDDQCTYTLSPTNINVDSSGVTDATFSVTTQAGCNWSASTNNSWISISSSNNGTGNGNVNYSVLENTGIARTGTIFVANQTFTINQSSGVVSVPNIFDFDGDSKTDVSIFRPSLGEWWYLRSSDLGGRALPFGSASDIPVPADFTGDGKTDVAFWRNGEWFILRSEDDSFFSFPWGQAGDIPAPGDFDGDNKADPTVFRPNDQTWFILKSTGGVDFVPFGVAEDKPVIADYDGDGKDDIAVYRPSVSEWWINQSTDGPTALQFGGFGDKTVQGDYTGDGKADVAFFRPNTGEWFIIRSEDFSFFSFPFGAAGDIAAPGDYDGDGMFDATVFRPTNTTWFINGTQSGVQIVGFGLNGDIPVPSVYSVP